MPYAENVNTILDRICLVRYWLMLDTSCAASRNVHRHDTKGGRGGYLVFQSSWVQNSERSVPFSQRQDETIIARRVGCTAVDRWERGNHVGGQWPPRRKRRAGCSGHVVVRHL